MSLLRLLETKREVVTLAIPALLALILKVGLEAPLWVVIVAAVASVVVQNLLVIWLREAVAPKQAEQISGGD